MSLLCCHVSAPHIPAPCSTLYTSPTRLTVSWPTTRGASHYDVQVHGNDTQELIYSTTVYSHTSTEIPLRVEPNSLYTIYVTGSAHKNRVGNTVSCTGVTGVLRIGPISCSRFRNEHMKSSFSLRDARSSKRGIVIVSRPSVCLSVSLRYGGHIDWTSSKLITRLA